MNNRELIETLSKLISLFDVKDRYSSLLEKVTFQALCRWRCRVQMELDDDEDGFWTRGYEGWTASMLESVKPDEYWTYSGRPVAGDLPFETKSDAALRELTEEAQDLDMGY